MFRRVLVANRGEIALRVIRACAELGVESVAVFSDADRSAPYVAAATRAAAIGPAPAVQSYLSIPRLLQAAAESGADAVHPGYGFLSENAAFAAACENHGLTFVGPPAAVIAAMGSKIEARRIVAAAGVPVVPGETPEDQSDAGLRRAIERLGFPVLVKASAGGGGKGMRRALSPADVLETAQAARREAAAAFGDGTLYVERLLERPRHIEVQIFADHHGHVVHLFERECSAQRRHQKVIEESPAPGLTGELRAQITGAAVSAAKAAGYRNAGTIEFLLADGRFYFLEMNTRLQVEHRVTEAVTGTDLVQTQLRVAAGEPLPWTQASLTQRGHAIEARVYAEDPAQEFLPQAGTVLQYREPHVPGVRVDSGIVEGSDVPVYYDPLLAKVIAAGGTRDETIAKLTEALQTFTIGGITTNVAFLIGILEDRRFRAGAIDTGFIDRELETLLNPVGVSAFPVAPKPGGEGGRRTDQDPWSTLTNWRIGGPLAAWIAPRAGSSPPSAFADERLRRDKKGGHYRRTGATGPQILMAPMPATVIKVLAAPGAVVKKGETLILLEAMKMELPLRAPGDATVVAVNCREGELVQPDKTLIELA